ncbi:MAG: CRISPR-associated endonuclease Cas2 [Deltaproteobacteria bacterium]|nr:CRISPR-associated endonuclease Cas2 [Deltaproteobacteria bacterium]
MAEPRHWHLVMYDVSGPAILRQVHKKLSAWGKPVQLSVFRVRCTARELEQLRFELAKIMGEEDRLMVVRLCPGCAARVMVRGDIPAPFEEDTAPFIMV